MDIEEQILHLVISVYGVSTKIEEGMKVKWAAIILMNM
jgi:hypothetical protein